MSAVAADSDADGYPDSLESYHNTIPSEAVSHPSPIYENVEVYLSADLADQADRPGEDGAVLKDHADGNDFSFSGSSLVPGLFGKGLVCSGSRLHAGDVVDTGAVSLTVSFWFKADDVQSLQFLACKGNRHSGADGWSMFIYDGKLRLRANHGVDGAARLTIDKAGIVAGQWHHVVMVLDQDLGKIVGYLDGVSSEDEDGGWVTDPTRTDTFASGVTFDNSGSLTIGSRDDGGFGFRGMVDDVAIARRGWSEDLVEMVFDAGIRGLSFGSLQDSDNDGLFDAWEVLQFGDLLQTAQGDFDGDGLGNGWEYENQIDASNPDVDADGFSDGLEVFAGSDWDDAADLPDEIFTGIASYHPFDADTVVEGESLDLAGGNHANLLGERPGTTAGLFGDSLSFVNAGGDERAEFGDVLDPGSGSYTVSFWFKADSVRHRVQFIASKGNIGSISDGWSVWLHYDGLLVRGNYGHDGGARLTLRHDGIQAGQWNHVALVINQQTGRWEASLNGSHSSNAASAWSVPSGRTDRFSPGVNFVSSSPLLIGLADNMGSEFQGQVDDFVIARRAYSPGELADLHTAGRLGINFSQMADADGDGMPDAYEALYLGGDALPDTDTDGDGISNKDEFRLGSRPDQLDSDGDGISDFDEFQNGTIPWDANSIPVIDQLLDTRGYLAVERWDGHIGYDVEDLTNDDMFYGSPTHLLAHGDSRYFDIPQGTGIRMRGYITAPVSGYYHFWLSASNAAELWLSKDSTKYAKRRIAVLGRDAGTGHGIRDDSSALWDTYVSQMSEAVYLEAGERYFMETLSSQYHIGDRHISLAWARPGQGRESLDMSHLTLYLGESGDVDDDYLPDAWEAQYGLSITDNGLSDRSLEGERGDFDSDGLSNREEYLAGTDPTNVDSDGDGLNDSDEFRSYYTNPLASDTPEEAIVSHLDLTTYFGSDDNWSMIDGGLISDTFRGSISWNMEVPSSGAWVIQVDTRLSGTTLGNDVVHANAYVDGLFIGRYALRYGSSNKAAIRMIASELAVGNHVLKLEIDNYIACRRVQIDSISLRQPSGIDLDSDGIPDWIEDLLAQVDYVKPHAATSRTSPFCLEGNARSREESTLNGYQLQAGKDAGHWYFDLPLQTGEARGYVTDFAHGLQVQGEVYWWATNVLDNEALTIRQGDSLRLGVWVGSDRVEHPNKKNSQEDGIGATITVEGEVRYLAHSSDTYEHQFDTSGVHQIQATHNTGVGGTLTVIVKRASLPDDATVVQNSVSYWTLQDNQADRSLFFEAGGGLNLGTLEEIDNSNYKFRLYPRSGGRYGVVARLWADGPILDVADVRSVTLTDALQNGVRTSYASKEHEGYVVLTSPLVVMDLPPGGKVVITIFRAGITFLDGSKTKTLYAADFINGVANLQFLIPENMSGGYCHSISIYDENGSILGRR